MCKTRIIIIAVLIFSCFLIGKVTFASNQQFLCPISGTGLLDATYPTRAIVISTLPYVTTRTSARLPQQLMEEVFRAYGLDPFHPHHPKIILTETYGFLSTTWKNNISEKLLLEGISEETIEKLFKHILRSDGPNVTWHQDYFESFYSPQTGLPLLRPFSHYEIYDPAEVDLAPIEAILTDDLGTIGPALPTGINSQLPRSERSFASGEMGGNIEGLPLGYCLKGDNLSSTVLDEACGGKDKIITIKTSWMAVGHVDEIFKLLPNHQNQSCPYSVMIASPSKAFELMQTPPLNLRPFLMRELSAGIDELDLALRRLDLFKDRGENLCTLIDSIPDRGPAQESTMDFGHCRGRLFKITNQEMSWAFEHHPELWELNQKIESIMNENVAIIQDFFKTKVAGCQAGVDLIPAPALFSGEIIGKGPRIGLPYDALSFLPNPTNSLVLEKTVLMSRPENSAFTTYLESEIRKRGLTLRLLDTWDFAHRGNGNLHCASHILPNCRPRK